MIPIRRASYRGMGPLDTESDSSYLYSERLIVYRKKRWKRKIANQELSEIAKQNLDSNTELWKAESKYIRLEPGETVVLQFNPEKIKHVEGQFGIRISYAVIDPNYSDKGEKKFETGKLTSKQIDSLLRQGKTTLQITRSGEGKETSYTVAAPN